MIAWNTLLKAGLFVVLVTFSLSFSLAQNAYWSNILERTIQAKGKREIIPEKYRTILLDKTAFQRQLILAPNEKEIGFRRSSTIIELPMADGSFQKFTVVESPIAEEGLLRKFPNLKTYLGKGVDDPTAMVRFDFLESGLHAMIKSKTGITFIDPYSQNDTEKYISYDVNDHHPNKEFTCHYNDEISAKAKRNHHHETRNSGNPVGSQLKILRVGIACTGEYATYHINAGRDPLGAIVTTLNRVNVLYESEVSTRMILISNNEDIIYTNPDTDPYTNNDLQLMLGENKTNLEGIIGKENYDLGHVFGTAGGGLAGINVICFDSREWGATGINQPVGDFFDVVYVGHEMGHQFGAPHTFNSCEGEGGSSTAFEPGSGTTIMAYAGLCGTDNITFNTDYYFHSGSYDRIVNGGSSCATYQATGNNPPVVSITSPSEITIPISTPFTLKGTATDTEGQALIYTWDQMDLGPISSLGSPSGTAPLFRFMPPIDKAERTFPQLSDLINNTSSDAEVLPTITREITFRLVARDQQLGGGGVDYAEYAMNVSANAGPFVVQSPNTAITWLVGAMATVTWDVANTTQSPVNCANVNILLSTDGGLTYPITLASNVPNNGSTAITVPNNIGTTNRVKVEAADNVFFDISNANFTIEVPTTPILTMAVAPNTLSVCGIQDAVYEISLVGLGGFDEAVSLSLDGAPANMNYEFSNNDMVPDANINLTLSNLTLVTSGTHSLTVNAASNSQNISTEIILNLVANVPSAAPTLSTPMNESTEVDYSPNFTWTALIEASSYTIEIATSPAFANTIVETATVAETNYQGTALDLLSVYYWRVKGNNSCGGGNYSSTFSFQTNQPSCLNYSADDVPIIIEGAQPNTITSVITIPHDLNITDLDVTKIKGTHSYVSDLSFRLKAPNNNERILAQYQCGEAANFDLGFDDSGAALSCPLDLANTHQPSQALSIFNGFSSQGDWTLNIQDVWENDGGALEEWSIKICHTPVAIASLSQINNNTLTINTGATGVIENSLLNYSSSIGNTSDIIYNVLSTPSNGDLNLNGTLLGIGGQFTQQDIDNNLLSFTNNGSLTNDQFTFDVIGNNGGWKINQVFNVSVQSSSFQVMAEITKEILCFGDQNASFLITPSGGTAPYEYSIDGANFLNTNTFTGLSAGNYNILVKDANQDMGSTSISINQASQITVSAEVINNSITATASGGTGTLVYQLDNNPFQPNNIFTNLSNSSYTITVKDENACTKSTTATVVVPDIVVEADLMKSISCHDETNAEVNILVTGGIPPYLYSIDGTHFQSSSNFTNLAAGIYTFYVKDTRDEMKNSESLNINNPSLLEAMAQAVEEQITIQASGGTGAMSYSINGSSFQSNNTFTGLSNGTYTISVMDGNECTTSTTATVFYNSLVVGAEVVEDVSCNGERDGVIKAIVSGGTAPLLYSLDGETFQQSSIFSELSPNNYIITVKDNDGFIRSTSIIELTNPMMLSLNANITGNAITLEATGGMSNYSYSINGTDFQNSNQFSNLENGSYTLTVKDINNCTATTTATVAFNSLVVSSDIMQFISCNGEGDGMITVDVQGGTAPFEYSLDGENFQTSNNFSNLIAGEYAILVKDEEGFTKTTNEIILVDPPTINLSVDVHGNNVEITATGGTGTLSFSLDGASYQDTNLFEEVPNGTYEITVLDENECSNTISATVSNNNLVVELAIDQQITCRGTKDAKIIAEVSGGKAPYQYSIDDGENYQNENNFNFLGPGTYHVKIKDADGFIKMTNEVQINDPDPIIVETSTNGNILTVVASGGTGDLFFSIDGNNFQSSDVFTDLSIQDYIVTVRDKNGCRGLGLAKIESTTSIHDLAQQIQFILYPNPSIGLFTVELNQSIDNDLEIQIFDVKGRIVWHKQIQKSNETLRSTFDVSHLSNGVYQMQVNDGKRFGNKRLVILKE